MSVRHCMRPAIGAACLALLLTLCLSACSVGTASVSKPTATSTAPAQHHIYVGIENPNGGFAVAALQARDGSPLWQRQIGGGATPINVLVSDDIIVAVQGRQLTALQASDGKILWQTSTHFTYQRAIVTDGMIIERSDASSQINSLIDAYRISDGKRLWEYNDNACEFGQIVGNSTGALHASAPAIHAVYLTISCTSDGTGGIVGTGGLLALRTSDGSVLWKNQMTEYSELNTPVLFNGVLYVNTVLDDIYAYRASDGMQLWHTAGVSPSDLSGNGFAPIVTDGTVGYVTENFDLLAFRLSDGTHLWTAHYKYITDVAKAADGVVYLFQGEAGLHLLRASDGSEIWGTASRGGSILATTADAVYVIHVPPAESAFPASYAVYALNSTDGSTLWTYDGKGLTFTSLALG